MPTPSKRAPILALLLCLLSASLLSAQIVSFDPKVPTPESVLGHKPGDDFYLASYDDSRGYFHDLAAASNRIKLITVGKTTRGLSNLLDIRGLREPYFLKKQIGPFSHLHSRNHHLAPFR